MYILLLSWRPGLYRPLQRLLFYSMTVDNVATTLGWTTMSTSYRLSDQLLWNPVVTPTPPASAPPSPLLQSLSLASCTLSSDPPLQPAPSAPPLKKVESCQVITQVGHARWGWKLSHVLNHTMYAPPARLPHYNKSACRIIAG